MNEDTKRIVEFIRRYEEVNFEICQDGYLMDQLLRRNPWTEENVKRLNDCSMISTVHFAKHNACREMAELIEVGEHLRK
jgi:hypothetical protein